MWKPREARIPTKSFVVKFIAEKYPPEKEGEKPVVLPSSIATIPIVLFSQFRRAKFGEAPLKVRSDNFFRAILPIDCVRTGKLHIDEKGLKFFEHYVKAQLIEDMCDFVDKKVLLGIQQKAAIRAFCSKFDIEEEDMKFETLIKNYQRHKNEKEAIEN